LLGRARLEAVELEEAEAEVGALKQVTLGVGCGLLSSCLELGGGVGVGHSAAGAEELSVGDVLVEELEEVLLREDQSTERGLELSLGIGRGLEGSAWLVVPGLEGVLQGGAGSCDGL
jgi:hypothetical protein